MSSSSPKTSAGNYQTNCCYQQSPYGNNVGQYSLIPTAHHHHQQQLVNNNVQSISPTSLSLVYANQQQQQTNPSNVLQTRYQNEQINDKNSSNSLTAVITNGQQQQSMTNNAAALDSCNKL